MKSIFQKSFLRVPLLRILTAVALVSQGLGAGLASPIACASVSAFPAPAILASAISPAFACAGQSDLTASAAGAQLLGAQRLLLQAPLNVKEKAQALLLRGLAYEALGRQGRASADWVRAKRLAPNLVEAWLGLGRTYFSHNLLARAVREFTQAIHLKPRSAEAYRSRAAVYDALDSFSRSLADYNQAIALEPSDACTYNDRAVTQEAAGQQDAALVSYSQALAIAPNLAAPLANRAFLLADMGRNREALADFDKGLALNPADTELQNGRTQVLSRLG